ncbi:MAG: head-tail connector protein [Janthinobacterium lividum]
MTDRLITPAQELAVPLETAKANLGFDGNDSDLLITVWLKGVIAHAENYTNRAFVHQTRRLTLDSFAEAIELERSPLASVIAIRFYDVDGQQQTLDPADYLVDTASEPGYVVPAAGKAWPATADRVNAVTVDYVAGYGPSDVTVPEEIQLYILAKLVEQFDPTVRLEQMTVQSTFIDSLLQSSRIYL